MPLPHGQAVSAAMNARSRVPAVRIGRRRAGEAGARCNASHADGVRHMPPGPASKSAPKPPPIRCVGPWSAAHVSRLGRAGDGRHAGDPWSGRRSSVRAGHVREHDGAPAMSAAALSLGGARSCACGERDRSPASVLRSRHRISAVPRAGAAAGMGAGGQAGLRSLSIPRMMADRKKGGPENRAALTMPSRRWSQALAIRRTRARRRRHCGRAASRRP